jgi:hypothetical protein
VQDPRANDNIADVAVAAFQVARNIMNLELEGLRALSSINENKFLRFTNRAYQDYYGTNNNDNSNGTSNSNILQP